MLKGLPAFVLLFATSTAMATAPGSKTFDASRYSQTVTGCDRLAAHPEDPFKVQAGLNTHEMDIVAAIAACRIALEQDPDNPRIQYQLARSLTYAGQIKEALPLLEKSAALDYPQALFVNGYLHLEGFAGAPKDACRAAELIRESAEYGRLAAILGYPAFALEGRFRGCVGEPGKAEIVAYLEAAKAATSDYYHGLLISALMRE